MLEQGRVMRRNEFFYNIYRKFCPRTVIPWGLIPWKFSPRTEGLNFLRVDHFYMEFWFFRTHSLRTVFPVTAPCNRDCIIPPECRISPRWNLLDTPRRSRPHEYEFLGDHIPPWMLSPIGDHIPRIWHPLCRFQQQASWSHPHHTVQNEMPMLVKWSWEDSFFQ